MRHKVEISGVNTTNIKVLSSKEMSELFEQMHKGNKFAREELVNGNLKLVLSILKFFNNRADNMEISQEMFSIENPHIKWISQINIKSQFNDYSINFENKYYH